ncbi:ubiquinol-cytochrome-c reductase complex assembly factor 4 [Osmerus eperlanus]|uniref:ubiquinol-cytochrome-c reductase complex assembly factor 4 n=1 Tax=Osmerus eperlanus TaxID=29151 RepID=UPI002E10B6FA
MSRAGYVVSRLAQYSLCRATRIDAISTSLRLNHSRTLTLTSQKSAKTKNPAADDDDKVDSQPIKFSTSKGSHKTWNVDKSLGSRYERPWWRVIPISIGCVAFLLWCVLRGETDIDEQLERHLNEHMPGLIPEEDEVVQNKTV